MKTGSHLQIFAITLLCLPLTLAAGVINIDFNGVRNVPGPDVLGPTYMGVGPAGGGETWNGIDADSRRTDGTDEDNLNLEAKNLLEASGNPTIVSLKIGPVGGDVCCAPATTEPTDPLALFNDYIFNNSAGNTAGESPFTISGLGSAAKADLYFFIRGGGVTIPGVTGARITDPIGIFTSANTLYFKDVPVVNGSINGTIGSGTAVIHGMTIATTTDFPAPSLPTVKSVSPSGNGVRSNASIAIQLEDSQTSVEPGTIRLSLNGVDVTTAISKPAGSTITTVSYTPTSPLPEGPNTMRLVFGNNLNPPTLQTADYTFSVINDFAASHIINLDMNGFRPGDQEGPTYSAPGVAGGGVVFNGVPADSTGGNDNLTLTKENLLDSIGGNTTISFTISPVGGDNNGAGSDSAAAAALFGDYVFVGSAGQTTGTSSFTIANLGDVPAVDLYFYFGVVGAIEITGSTPAPFTPSGPFTANNTLFFRSVPVSNGQIQGTFGKGTVALLHGLTIKRPFPKPFVKSTSPAGAGVLDATPIRIELLDYISKVVPSSVQLKVNGQSVSAVVSKPAGSALTTIDYQAPGGLPPGPNTVEISFGDDANPPQVQTHSFSFDVISRERAETIVNIDFNGVRNVPGPDVPGPTYSGQSAAGGANMWNGILADSRLEDGTDEDNLTIEGSNLLNSLGEQTSVRFFVAPMGGDVGGAPTTNPNAQAALFSDYIFNNSAGNTAGESPFTIDGLGSAPFVDLYFYRAVGTITVNGAAPSAFTPTGIFTAGNTVYFRNVPVVDGKIEGKFGTGVTVVNGMSIVFPLRKPFVKSTSPTGSGVPANTGIKVELQDYVSSVVPESVQLFVNNSQVTPVVSKPAGSSVTTVTYQPPQPLGPDSVNTVKIVFGDSSTPSKIQSAEFNFKVLNEAAAAKIVNIDFNGARHVPGPHPPGATYSGAGPAEGGTFWNGVLVDSRLEDGTDEDNLTVTATDLKNSLGNATTIEFTVSPVGGDNGASPTLPSTEPGALFGDYFFNNSAGNLAGESPFTISGLGSASTVDLYFLRNAGNVKVTGGTTTAFSGAAPFTSGNTVYFKNVPVVNGSVSGSFGPGTTVISGMTIRIPLPVQEPLNLSISRQPGGPTTISWQSTTAKLQTTTTIGGQWTELTDARSPFQVITSGPHQFFRLSQ